MLPLKYNDLGTINAVKLLPIVESYSGYIRLYTELDSHIEVGDNVFITYSGDTITYNDELLLDNFLYFRNSVNYYYSDFATGYEIIFIDKETNSIVINRKLSTIPNNTILNDHYISKISINKAETSNIKIDSSIFRTIDATNVNWIQGVVLGGDLNITDIDFKYQNNYISQKLNYIPPSTYSKNISLNNNGFGYSYFYDLNTSINNCEINSGMYNNCHILENEINGGYFSNCNLDNLDINGGYFKNSTLTGGTVWNGGKWESTERFDGIWNNGDFLSGTFGENSIWMNGNFYDGIFNGKTWYNGKMMGGIFNGTTWTESSVNKATTWHDGIMSGGKISGPKLRNSSNHIASIATIKISKIFIIGGQITNLIIDNANFNKGLISECVIKNSIIDNNAIIEKCDIINSTINNSYISDSVLADNNINNSKSIKDSKFLANNYLKNGDFENNDFINPIIIDNGSFNNNVFSYNEIIRPVTGGLPHTNRFHNETGVYASITSAEVLNSSLELITVTRLVMKKSNYFNNFIIGNKINFYLNGFDDYRLNGLHQTTQITYYDPTKPNTISGGVGYDEVDFYVLDILYNTDFENADGMVSINHYDQDLSDAFISEKTTINGGDFKNDEINRVDIYDGHFKKSYMHNGVNFYNGTIRNGRFSSYTNEIPNNFYGGIFFNGVFGNTKNIDWRDPGEYVDFMYSGSFVNGDFYGRWTSNRGYPFPIYYNSMWKGWNDLTGNIDQPQKTLLP